jgi:CRP/FNR family transcriptional regulator, dissimilatory nitrate respiration regulator
MGNTHSELTRVALAETLRGAQLFSGLPLADLENIAGFSQLVRVSKGEYLFREHEPALGFYVMQTGAINVHRVSAAGKEQLIHVFRAGETFAEAALAITTGYPADARAVENSSVVLVPKREFVELLGRRPELALRMLASMSTHLRVLVGLLEDLQLKDVETRLAHWLLQRSPAGKQSYTIKLQSTKRVLAAEMSTTSETLSRTFAKFRDAGWIAVRAREISLLSRAGLEQLLNKNLGG